MVAVGQARAARDAAIKQEEVSRFLSGMLSPRYVLDVNPFTVIQMLDAAEKKINGSRGMDPVDRVRASGSASVSAMRLCASATVRNPIWKGH